MGKASVSVALAGRRATALRASTALAAALATIVATGGSAFAQGTMAADGSTALPQLEVGSGIGGEPGADEVIITLEDLERTNPSDLQDLFAQEPNISISSPLQISQKLYVNGVEEPNLAVTIDGSRQNNKIFHHNATTLIDPELLKSVRVDPGVAPADAGPGALAGSVAFETKTARDLLEPGRMLGGIVTSRYETNGDIFTNSATVFGAKDGFEALGYLKYATGDLMEDGDGRTIIGSEADFLSGLAKVAYEADNGYRLDLGYERVRDDGVRPYRADFGRQLGGRPVPDTRIYDLRRQNFSAKLTHVAPDGWFDPTVQLNYSVTDLDVIEPGAEVVGSTDSINGKAENRFALANGSIVTGIDFYNDTADYEYFLPPAPAAVEAGTESATNIGVYSQARLDLTNRARVSFGGRGDFQQFEGVGGYEEDNAGLSGNVSGEYDITDFLTASAGYSHVWAGIPLAENFIINPAWDYTGGIEPVTADNYTAGLRAEFGQAYVEGSIFRTDINDARTPEYGGSPALSKDVRTEGYELAAGYEWLDGFVRVGFADIDADIEGRQADGFTGRYLTTPIGQIITFGAAHTFADWGLTVGTDMQFALENGTIRDDGTPGEPQPAYEVVNAYVEYVPRQFENLTLRAEVNNLFDETYSSRASYGQEFAEIEPLREPGRSFMFQIKARF